MADQPKPPSRDASLPGSDGAKPMTALVAKLRILLNPRQRRNLGLVGLGMMVSAALEMVSLAAIPAFVALLVQPEHLLAALPEGGLRLWLESVELPRLTLLAAITVAALFLCRNLFSTGMVYAATRLVQGIRISVARRLFDAYLHSPYTFHLQRNPSELINTLTGEVGRAMGIIDGCIRLGREGLVLIVVFGLLLAVDPWVSLSVFVMMTAASATFYLVVRRALSRRGKHIQEHWARLTQASYQALGAIKEARLLGREPHLVELFALESAGIRRHEVFQQVVGVLPRLFLEILAVLAVIVVVGVFMLMGRPVQEMLPLLALLAMATVRLVPSLSTINAALAGMRFNLPALELVSSELAALEGPAVRQRQASAAPGTRARLEKALSLHDVHFGYEGTASPALHGVSLDISVGEAVGFIGASGAGKSTLIDVILGLLVPSSGEVRVDGRDIQTDPTGWQRQIGYVPQEIYLMDDTIRRNIAFGLPDDAINEAALARALGAARLDDFVATLPEGLDTLVGNMGIRLSGGQRQRIGIARALYHNPGVLVLDEATSSLDNETEREVIAAINRLRGDRTIIMIAHRLTTVQGCDRLYLLENGRIKDEGSFADLALRHPHLGLTIRPMEPVEVDGKGAP